MRICPKCDAEHDRQYSYCLKCQAAYKREWRRSHALSEDERIKDKSRSYAGVYLRRGKLTKGKCELCGSRNTEMHHDDYAQPLEVRWLCRTCHRALHVFLRYYDPNVTCETID